MSGHRSRAYVYVDVKGRPRLRKIRFEPKALLVAHGKKPFTMQSWSATIGGWVPGVRDEVADFADRALYHLDELLWALSQHRATYIVEGEKDADAIRAVGGSRVAATTGWQGASRFTEEQARWFSRGSGPIYVVADVDSAGAYSGLTRYELLRGVGVPAKRLRVIAAPRPHNDPAAALEAGALRADLPRLGLRRVSMPRLRAAAGSYAAERAARGERGSSDWMRGEVAWRPQTLRRHP